MADKTDTRKKRKAAAWKPAFIHALAATGNVLEAQRVVGKARSTIYKARDRDTEFAVQWDAALETHREKADRAEADRTEPEPKRPRGSTAWRKGFLDTLAATGSVHRALLENGVGKTTAYEARKKDEEFAAQWKNAIDLSVDLLEVEVRRRALRGVQKAIYYRGEVVGYVREYSDRLAEFLLRANRPAKYREGYRPQDATDEPPVRYVKVVTDE